jgi:hypothetical protein
MLVRFEVGNIGHECVCVCVCVCVHACIRRVYVCIYASVHVIYL